MSKKNERVSFSLRLQPYTGSLMAEIVNWLNLLERDEAKKKIEAALIMAYLPLAKDNSGAERAAIERSCWETQDLLDKHGSSLRQILDVPQLEWYKYEAIHQVKQEVELVKAEEVFVEESSVDNFPESQIEGKGSFEDTDAFFGDD